MANAVNRLSERELQDWVLNNIQKVLQVCQLHIPLKSVWKERLLNPKVIQNMNPPKPNKGVPRPRADILIEHGNTDITIIEIKQEREVSDLLKGVAQCLYYESLLTSFYPDRKVHTVLFTTFESTWIHFMIDKYNMPIRYCAYDGEFLKVYMPKALMKEGQQLLLI